MDVLAEYYHWPDPVTAAIILTPAAVAGAPAAAAGVAAIAVPSAAVATTAGIGAAGVAGIALGAAGLASSAYGQVRAGQAAAAQAKGQEAMAAYNARVQQQEAEMAAQQSIYRQNLHNREMSRQQSSLLASLSASGADPSAGTPLLIQAMQASEAEMDRLMIAYQGQIASGRALSQGNMDRLQANIYGQRAKNEATAGYLKAGTSLLTGFGQYFADKE